MGIRGTLVSWAVQMGTSQGTPYVQLITYEYAVFRAYMA